MSASTTPDTPVMKALYRATWFLVHEADTRAAAGDAEAAQSFYAAIQFLAEVRKHLTAPVEAWPKAPPSNDAAVLAELRKLFMVPDGHDLLVHAKAVADQWMAVGAPADPIGWGREDELARLKENPKFGTMVFGEPMPGASAPVFLSAAPAAQVAYPSEDHGCVYENGDGICRECADLAAANKAAAQVAVSDGWTPEDIQAFARAYKQEVPGASLTVHGIAFGLEALRRPSSAAAPAVVVDEAMKKRASTAYHAACNAGSTYCPNCGGTGRERDNYTECETCEGSRWVRVEGAPDAWEAALAAALKGDA